MQVIDISELPPQIRELLSKIHSGEELFIVDKEQPVAKLILIKGETNGSISRRQFPIRPADDRNARLWRDRG